MGNLNEKEKRDFVSQTIILVENEASVLTGAGYDPTDRMGQLKTKLTDAEAAEAAQQKAQALAWDATKEANRTLDIAYEDASAVINLIEGLLGKDNSLLRKLRQLRK